MKFANVKELQKNASGIISLIESCSKGTSSGNYIPQNSPLSH